MLQEIIPDFSADNIPRSFQKVEHSTSTKREYEIAGFCFIPKWEINTLDNGQKEFTTIGIRVVTVLWELGENAPNKMLIAGFDKIADAFDPMEPSDNSPTIELLIPRLATSQYSEEETAQISRSSREFDFVFLEFDRYLELATSNVFYNGNSRTIQGIIMGRSFINYDNLGIKRTPTGRSEMLIYRSLYFKPYPEPDLPEFPILNRASIAIDDGKRCPPWWWNEKQ